MRLLIHYSKKSNDQLTTHCWALKKCSDYFATRYWAPPKVTISSFCIYFLTKLIANRYTRYSRSRLSAKVTIVDQRFVTKGNDITNKLVPGTGFIKLDWQLKMQQNILKWSVVFLLFILFPTILFFSQNQTSVTLLGGIGTCHLTLNRLEVL